jgi:hypothetical protein
MLIADELLSHLFREGMKDKYTQDEAPDVNSSGACLFRGITALVRGSSATCDAAIARSFLTASAAWWHSRLLANS